MFNFFSKIRYDEVQSYLNKLDHISSKNAQLEETSASNREKNDTKNKKPSK
jgi:hypothetical protein